MQGLGSRKESSKLSESTSCLEGEEPRGEAPAYKEFQKYVSTLTDVDI